MAGINRSHNDAKFLEQLKTRFGFDPGDHHGRVQKVEITHNTPLKTGVRGTVIALTVEFRVSDDIAEEILDASQ
jgi:hypothetical protein